MAKTSVAPASASARRQPKRTARTQKKSIAGAPASQHDIVEPKSVKRPPIGLPGSFRLLGGTYTLIRNNWQVFLGIALLYALLNALLIQGFNTAADLANRKEILSQLPGSGGQLTNGLSLYTSLLGASGSSLSPTAGAYQFVLAVIASLALIWLLRQVYAGYVIRIRDGFYRGMYPLVTFLLVMLMILVQLLPMAAGLGVYSIIISNGIAVNPVEQFLFLLLFLGLALVSLYMLCSSLFALYIVTLPEITPMSALRSARELVAGRRWAVMRRVVFLPFALLGLSAVVLLPVVLFATPIATWVFTAVAGLLLVVVHTYMYNLYRALL